MSWTNQENFFSTVHFNSGTQSIYHDGTTEASPPILDMPSFDASSDFTIEFFCYYDGSGLMSPVTVYDRTTERYIIFWPAGGTAYLQWSTNSGVTFKNYSVSPTMAGRWVHMACTYIQLTDTIYFAVDGVVNSYTADLSADFKTATALEAHFHIWPNNPASRIFEGYVDDFKVTSSAIYTSAYTVPDATTWTTSSPTVYLEGMEPLAPLEVVPGVLTIGATITDTGANAYRISITPDGGSEIVSVSSTTDLTHTIQGLSPETTYTVSLYADVGSGFVFETADTVTTLANVSTNYETSAFGDSTNGFDLTNLDETSRDLISSVMNDLFVTGDPVSVKLDNGQNVDTLFVNLGTSAPIEDSEAVLAPFDSGNGAGQSVTMTLSDTSTSSVDFNEVASTIVIGGVTYSVGDTLVLDGKKVTIRET